MEINAKKLDPPVTKEVGAGFLMACVDQTELIGNEKLYRFKKIHAHNGARTIGGDWERAPRNPRIIKYNKNFYILLETKTLGTKWLDSKI